MKRSTLIAAVCLAIAASSAQAYTTQELNAVDEYCTSSAKMAGAIHSSTQKGKPLREDLRQRLIDQKDGAIMEWSLKYSADNINLPVSSYYRAVYAKCVDNAKNVLLDAREGNRMSVDLLR
jgi:hypothetical protein